MGMISEITDLELRRKVEILLLKAELARRTNHHTDAQKFLAQAKELVATAAAS